MKKILSALTVMSVSAVLLSSANAHAYTHGTFVLGGRAIFTIQNPPMGPADNDANVLYDAMNVPAKPSFIGPGKSIVTGNKDFNLVCGIRNNGALYTCSLVVQESNRVNLDMINRKAEFTLHGAEAKAMSDLFVKKADGKFSYSTTDGEFVLSGTDDEFRFSYVAK